MQITLVSWNSFSLEGRRHWSNDALFWQCTDFTRDFATSFLYPASYIQQPQVLTGVPCLIEKSLGPKLENQWGNNCLKIYFPKSWFLCLSMQVTRWLLGNKNRRYIMTGTHTHWTTEIFSYRNLPFVKQLLCSKGKLAKTWSKCSPTALRKNKQSRKCLFK